MKRIHLKNQPPEIHGMIAEHMASHGHKSMEDTVTCLIREAMRRFDEADKITDLTTLVNLHGSENDKLKTALDASQILNESQRHKISELFAKLEKEGLDEP